MKQYRLTEQEARVLASQIAGGLHKVVGFSENYDKWFNEYMKTYNEVMDAIDRYNRG